MNKAVLRLAYEHFTRYQAWLVGQPLAENTKRVYRSRLNHFLAFVAQSGAHSDVFTDASERDNVVKTYKRYLGQSGDASPNSINAALAAANHFYQFLGLPPTKTKRVELSAEVTGSLTGNEQQKLLLAAQCTRRSKDRAILTLLLFTGIRISECAVLRLNDVITHGRRPRVIVRASNGGHSREIPLNVEACKSIQEWLNERSQKFADRETVYSGETGTLFRSKSA
ncbi:MAG: tyrosine-type recombinase/integrase [Cyanobacteria bacterium SZAS LIN-3]|nr:tyrosine-type recombinase/integrase [Cyanobacteria bacterium SZAS LIN-3]